MIHILPRTILGPHYSKEIIENLQEECGKKRNRVSTICYISDQINGCPKFSRKINAEMLNC